MIVGIGFDLIEIERIKKAARNERFYTKNFTQDEIDFFKSRKNNIEVVAGNFAAKEAVLKCLEIGIFDVPLCDIEILRKPSGKPYVSLYGGALEQAKALGIDTVHVSISHIEQHAAAQAIAEHLAVSST